MRQLDIIGMCKRLRPFLGSKADEIFMEYSLSDTKERKQELFQLILTLYSKYVDDNILDNEVILRQPPKDLSAEYDLGKIEFPNKEPKSFGLREQDWIRHVCVTGMSGSGKTTFARRIIYSLIQKDKNFIIFDWKKSFRQMISFSDKVAVFTVGKPNASNLFRTNINKPPKDVSPDEWITILCDLLCECYGASYGVHKLLTEVMQKAFRDFGVYSGSENYPTWYQIKNRLVQLQETSGRSRQSEWLTSALRIAHSLTFGEFGKTINDKAKYNLSVEEMLSAQAVFELESLGSMEKKFFSSFMLLYIYKFKKANTNTADKSFDTAILVDEAHNVFLKQRTNFVQESVTDTIYREIREYGIGLICLDQHASKLSDTVLGNSSTNIAFQQILPEDVDAIARLMFIADEKSIYTRLDVGQAVVKLTDRYHDPFLIRVEMLDVPDDILSDAELRKRMKKHVLFKRRMKLWQDMMKVDNLAQELVRVKAIYGKSGVLPPDDHVLEKQIKIGKDIQDALVKDEKTGIVNHLQQQILDTIIDVLRSEKSIKAAKKVFAEEGYRLSDINRAFKHFSETRRGQVIVRFLELFNSRFKNFKQLDPIWIIDFIQKLHDVDAMPTTLFYKTLGISFRKGNDVKNALIDVGLVIVRDEKTSKGVTKRIALSKDGLLIAERVGITA